MPFNYFTQLPYQGRNINELLRSAMTKGYKQHAWGTFLQWKQAGYKVRKGEKGTHGVTFGETTKTNKAGKVVASSYAKAFVVFNIEQVEKVA